MSEEPENLVLVYLRRIDANVQDLRADMTEVKRRLTRLEVESGRILRDRGDDVEERARMDARIDRMREEIERIKRRLDIAD